MKVWIKHFTLLVTILVIPPAFPQDRLDADGGHLDAAVMFAHDISQSISASEYRRLKSAFLQALRSSRIPCMVSRSRFKKVVLSFGHWSQKPHHSVQVDWTLVQMDDEKSKARDWCQSVNPEASLPSGLQNFISKVTGWEYDQVPRHSVDNNDSSLVRPSQAGETKINEAIGYYFDHFDRLDEQLAKKGKFVERRILVMVLDGEDSKHVQLLFSEKGRFYKKKEKIKRLPPLENHQIAIGENVEIYPLVLPAGFTGMNPTPYYALSKEERQRSRSLFHYAKYHVQAGPLKKATTIYKSPYSYEEHLRKVLNNFMM